MGLKGTCGHTPAAQLSAPLLSAPSKAGRDRFPSDPQLTVFFLFLLYAFMEPFVMLSFLFWLMYTSSILAWRIPWTEEPGGRGLQSGGLQRVGHDRACTRGIRENPSLQPDDCLHSFLHRPGPGQLHVHWNSTWSQTAWLQH